MTMATFHLQIVTPDRLVYDGEARQIILRTVGGDAAILAGHIDYSAPLGIGEAKLTDGEGNERSAACQGGMVTVSGGQVRVMTRCGSGRAPRARARGPCGGTTPHRIAPADPARGRGGVYGGRTPQAPGVPGHRKDPDHGCLHRH